MICKFTGGLADGALSEIALEHHWVDEVPPALLWVYSCPQDSKSPYGLRATVSRRTDATVYKLTAITNEDELQNVVYHYTHFNPVLDIDNLEISWENLSA